MWNSSAPEIGANRDEEALYLAALQRSPTYVRARTSIFRHVGGEISLVDVGKLNHEEQKVVVDKLVNAVSEDTELFFNRVRQRFDA